MAAHDAHKAKHITSRKRQRARVTRSAEVAVTRRARPLSLSSALRELTRGLATLLSVPRHTPPPRPQAVRDFAFRTEAEGVAYFATHRSLCEDVYGLAHGDHIRFHAGAWAESTATVVGSRGGYLWVVVDGDTAAQPLRGVAKALSRGRAWQLLQRAYAIEVLHKYEHGANALQVGQVAAVATRSPSFAYSVLCEVDAEARRAYSDAQRTFLQCAPDLFVTVVRDHDDDDGNVDSGNCTHGSNGNSGSMHSSRHHSSDRCSVAGVRPDEAVYGEGESCDEVAARDVCQPAAREHWCWRLLARVRQRCSRPRTDFAVVAHTHHLIVLAPCLVLPSRSLGWCGEGVLLIDAGGVRNFRASMSVAVTL